MDRHEQVVAKFCIPYRNKLVDILIGCSNNGCNSIAYAWGANNKSSDGKPGEKFENGINKLGKGQLGNFEISQSQNFKISFYV